MFEAPALSCAPTACSCSGLTTMFDMAEGSLRGFSAFRPSVPPVAPLTHACRRIRPEPDSLCRPQGIQDPTGPYRLAGRRTDEHRRPSHLPPTSSRVAPRGPDRTAARCRASDGPDPGVALAADGAHADGRRC